VELKTKIIAVSGKQEIFITREFDLPVELLFKAFTELEFIEQWMGTKVLTLDNKNQGWYTYETTDPFGNKHLFSGTIHSIIWNKQIVRTFEMENTLFPPQLEFLEFENIDNEKSKLQMQVVYKSESIRDQILQLPFAQGINMAHNRIQEIANRLK
jgi:uncharacterized protein YndB with AHSA1/START domain